MDNKTGNGHNTATIAPANEESLSLPDLIASYGDRLLRSAYLMCGHSCNAQDIVQETFCRALAGLPDFRGEAGVYTWLYTIMRKVCLQNRRRESRFLRYIALQPRVSYTNSNPAEHCDRFIGILDQTVTRG